MNLQQEQLDPTIVNMAKAIKQSETGGQKDPYNTPGKSGEFGAYQYTPKTWAEDSKTYLGTEVPLQGSTIEQQNKVAYYKIKSLKDQGFSPIQVASYWNSNDEDAYKGVFTKGKLKGKASEGYNSSNTYYSVPKYAESVSKIYQQLKAGVLPNAVITPPNPSSTTGNTGTPDSSVQNDPNAPQNAESRPTGIKGVARDIADPFLRIGASVRSLGDLTGSIVGQATGNQDLNERSIADYNKGQTQGFEGGLGNVKPLGASDTAENALKDSIGTGIQAGTTLTAAAGAEGLLAKLASSGLKSGTAIATEEAQSVLQSYARATGSSLSRISSGEAVNALTEAASKAEPAIRPILQKAAEEALAIRMKEAGIGSFSELNPTTAKLLGLSWKGIKGLTRVGLEIGGLGLLSRFIK